MQDRSCAGGECNAAGHCASKPYALTPKCNPANFLDLATGGVNEDNAAFVDRHDAAGRRGNLDGFIRGPVHSPSGGLQVNDRIAVISFDDIMPKIMQRVALEVALCLREYASQPGNRGRYPWPAPACRQGDPDTAVAWSDAANILFGRVPDPPFRATRASSAGEMQEDWTGACAIAGNAGPGWWNAWRWHVFYAIGPAVRPQPGAGQRCTDESGCLQAQDAGGRVLANGREFAVLVAGTPLATGALTQSRAATASTDARQWLEGSNAELRRMNPNPAAATCAPDPAQAPCAPLSSCNRVTVARGSSLNDVALAWP
jgi:hypothetical protein